MGLVPFKKEDRGFAETASGLSSDWKLPMTTPRVTALSPFVKGDCERKRNTLWRRCVIT